MISTPELGPIEAAVAATAIVRSPRRADAEHSLPEDVVTGLRRPVRVRVGGGIDAIAAALKQALVEIPTAELRPDVPIPQAEGGVAFMQHLEA